MKVVEIREESEFRALKSGWEALLRDSGASVFLSPEWLTAWWSAYGTPGDLRILTATDDNGVLRGVAPLRAGTLQRYGQKIPSLSFAGDGSNDSDYLDLMLAPGHEEPVMEAFRRRWSEDLKSGTILQLNELPHDSRSLTLLKRMAEEERSLWIDKPVACASVSLSGSWEDYLGRLRPRFRTKVRSVLRTLEGRQDVQIGFCEDPEQVTQLLPILFDLHTRRWATDGKPGVFGAGQKRDFYSAVSRLLLDRGWLRLSWLKWNGRILACQYGFVYDGVYSQLQEGYEPAAEHLSLGIGLRAWSIRALLGQGVREYDFLSGVKRGKTDWGAQTKDSRQILIASDTWKNRLVCYGPEWEQRGRETVKRKLPEKLVAARAARLSRLGATPPAASAEWVRKAAASCYLYSQMPRLMRPLRDRYQISFKSNGAGRGFNVQKRGQTAARILYYHRVNDDNDPFFPAISTTLFEQEMRFVSKHYKVVSVADLLDRLQTGSQEPALAVTFDDGYQDNYTNALPILRRYGLPAMIFLSTGSLDSRQPLWFEELAGALKRTDREYLDLEMDFPRRFPLRTQEERLTSNGEIFGFLRRMHDAERKTWLQEILRQTGPRDPGEQANRMLTWDQVRLMKEHGIDFGGHTVTHPFVSQLTREEAAWEVSECKRRIEQELQHRVDHFAYPNGREEDFGQWNKEILREAGYSAAMTTIWGLNYASTDPMELRRGGPWEETAAMFAWKLDWYQWVNG